MFLIYKKLLFTTIHLPFGDSCILGQLRWQVIACCLYQYNKGSCRDMTKVLNKFHQGELTIKTFWTIFSGNSIKT